MAGNNRSARKTRRTSAVDPVWAKRLDAVADLLYRAAFDIHARIGDSSKLARAHEDVSHAVTCLQQVRDELNAASR